MKSVLMEAVKQMWLVGFMGRILNESLIILILKLNAAESVKNWRFIFLFTIVYKIFSKVLVRRVGLWMDKWVF